VYDNLAKPISQGKCKSPGIFSLVGCKLHADYVED